jgi:ATP adenylyltransferase
MPLQRDDPGCVFCTMHPDYMIAENALALAVRDTSPVTELHTLVLPRRHVGSYFDLTGAERSAIHELLERVRCHILTTDPGVGGFNIGVNVGEIAGQTIFHCHVHLIPRRLGDVANPRGGVRAVIPEKQSY